MSSRAPGAAPAGMPPYRKDDERRRDEARVTTLQNQLDELRQALRELASRQVRIEETIKLYEGGAAQNRLTIEQLRQESQQSAQARALDENRTRQQIVDLEQRIDDATRPVRSLTAHVNELLEASRKKTDDSGQHLRRYEELRGMIEHLQAVGDRGAVMVHQLRDTIDNVRSETEQLRRDLLRSEDAIKIVDQEARRRVAEVAQAAELTSSRIDELRSDIAHCFDLIEEARRSTAHVDPTLQELRETDSALRQDLTRFQQQAIERHESLVERQDDIRESADAQFAELRAAVEQRFERMTERIDGLADQHRELGYRISTLAMQLDELRQADAGIRRDLWALHEQRVRLRLEQIQQELDLVTGSRRIAEAQPAAAPQPPTSVRALDT